MITNQKKKKKTILLPENYCLNESLKKIRLHNSDLSRFT